MSVPAFSNRAVVPARHAYVAAAALLLAAIASTSVYGVSPVVRPAPDFAFSGVGSKRSLRSLRGQPVVVVIARSPDTGAFKKQAKRLAPIYQEFASRGTVFVAAFSERDGQIPSNIPFVVAANGPALATAYGLSDDFRLAIVGQDGNLDLVTDKVLPAFRVREVIQNSYAVQQAARKVAPKGPPAQ
jgi:hypothetical protein